MVVEDFLLNYETKEVVTEETANNLGFVNGREEKYFSFLNDCHNDVFKFAILLDEARKRGEVDEMLDQLEAIQVVYHESGIAEKMEEECDCGSGLLTKDCCFSLEAMAKKEIFFTEEQITDRIKELKALPGKTKILFSRLSDMEDKIEVFYSAVYDEPVLLIESDEESVLAVREYCNVEDCNCNHVSLDFYNRSEELVGSFLYDYELEEFLAEGDDYELGKKMSEMLPKKFFEQMPAQHERLRLDMTIYRQMNEDGSLSSFLSALNERQQIGRNDPCFCGSGRKYKKCCWRK